MTDKKFDITSTALEKGLDIAKDFVDKLIMPSIEEAGLLIKDKVTMWRFSNQVKMLNKANDYCQKHKISPKKISLKLLSPLLEHAGLEEDDLLQDKWATLLSNMVDSEQNIENHVFPYILSQISTGEFLALETTLKLRGERKRKLSGELEELKRMRPEFERQIKEKLEQAKKLVEEKLQRKESHWEAQQDVWKLSGELRSLDVKENQIAKAMGDPQYLSGDLEEYETSNLIRLGLIRLFQKTYGYVTTSRIRNNPNSEFLDLEDAAVEIETEFEEYLITELGELFVQACSEKKTVK